MDWELAGKIIWILFALAWVALRWVPHRRSRRTKVETTVKSLRERFSVIMSSLGLGIVPVIWIFTGFPKSLDYAPQPVLVVIGALVCILALYLFRRTHKALGAMWSFGLDIRDNHHLVVEGIYQKVRHPMYSAFWLWAVAQLLLLSNWAAGLAAIIGFGTLYFLRVGQEEAMMMKEFGEEYETYMARTGRIVPKLR